MVSQGSAATSYIFKVWWDIQCSFCSKFCA